MRGAAAAHTLVDASCAWSDAPLLPSASAQPVRVVAVIGPQASGKSTLANALFHADFPTAPRGAVGVATTRGIDAAAPAAAPAAPALSAAAHAELQQLVVLDVEGADARARGRAGKAFAARATAFVTSLADAVLLNVWYHDTARVDSAGYGLLRTVLLTQAKAIVESAAALGDVQPRTSLIFVVRDVDDDVTDAHVSELLVADATEMWSDVVTSVGLQPGLSVLEDAFDISCVLLPHIRHHAAAWEDGVDNLRERLATDIATSAHSKSLPADDFLTYAATLWEALAYSVAATGAESAAAAGLGGGGDAAPCPADIAPDDYFAGEDLVIVAAYRCDEVFSALLAEASGDIADLHDRVDQGDTVDNLGETCQRLIASTLERYDAEATEFANEPVYERKRRELEAIVDTGLHAVFLRHLQICREQSIKSFKASLEEDLPADYAVFSTDAEFVRQASRAQRPGSAHWSYESEREDLRNMLSEIAAQHQKLVTTQVTASEQQSQAIQFLQMQHAQMRAVQQQALGGGAGQWSLGAAYRPPDTNVNVSASYQQGRTNLSVSLVPDESASLLGPSGFTAGGLLGNMLGLSFNVNL